MYCVGKVRVLYCNLHGKPSARPGLYAKTRASSPFEDGITLMGDFCLSKSDVKYLAARYETPFFVISLAKVRENILFFRENMPRVRIYYAMKANPSPGILTLAHEMGTGFDTASAGEMTLLSKMGVPGEKMLYANPVKPRSGLLTAAHLGVRRMVFDDADEIEKMAKITPGADVLVRIRVHNPNVLVDLNAKFGAAPKDALNLLKIARDAGLNPRGISFHVGSQSLSESAYTDTLVLCRRIFDEAEAEGIPLSLLDIGGGFPIPLGEEKCPDVGAMMRSVEKTLDELFPSAEISAEPGRFLCGTAANLVTSVIGVKRRGDSFWYTLDDGVYGVLSGTIYDHWTFSFKTFREGPLFRSSLLGPSCDSVDFVRRDIMLPKLRAGDLLLTPDCGAYTSASATTFNGFPVAREIIYEDEIKRAAKEKAHDEAV